MNTAQPLVSCIMPTANREQYIPFAIYYFMHQTYKNKELIIIDDGKKPVEDMIPRHPSIKYYYAEPIGLKRNYACERANGEVIMHWDDDDWYAADWISRQVEFLDISGADMCGIQHVHYYTALHNKFFTVMRQYQGMPNPNNWVTGASLAYWKSFWEKHPFQDLQKGEDDNFIQQSGGSLFIHDYIDGFVCLLHPHNTTIKSFENPKHKVIRP